MHKLERALYWISLFALALYQITPILSLHPLSPSSVSAKSLWLERNEFDSAAAAPEPLEPAPDSIPLAAATATRTSTRTPTRTATRTPTRAATAVAPARTATPNATPKAPPKSTPTPTQKTTPAFNGDPCTPTIQRPFIISKTTTPTSKQAGIAGAVVSVNCPSSSSTLAAQTAYLSNYWWHREIDPDNDPNWCPGYTWNASNRVMYSTDNCNLFWVRVNNPADNDTFYWNFYDPSGALYTTTYWKFLYPSNPENLCTPTGTYYSWKYSDGSRTMWQCWPWSTSYDIAWGLGISGHTAATMPGIWPVTVTYNGATLVSDYFILVRGIGSNPQWTYALESACFSFDPKLVQGNGGDPVNLFTGNFTEQFIDLSIPARGFPLAFERSYNSLDAANATTLGFGWTHSYNMRLTFSTQYGVTFASLVAGRGSRFEFSATSYGTFISAPGVRAQLVQNVDGSYTLTDSHQNRYSFDSAGRLTQLADANGNAQTFTFNGSQLTSVSDAGGRALQFGYDGNGRITQITDPLGRSVGFGYDGNGDLTMVRDTRGLTTTMTYDTSHQLLTLVDPNGHTRITNHYDAQNRVDYQLDALNQQTTFSYTPGMTQTAVTDPRTNRTTYNYNSSGLLASVDDALERRESYVYDGHYNRTSITDRNGNQTKFTWNASGCNPASVTDALGNVANFYYDSYNNLTDSYDPLNRHTRYVYDAGNNLTSIIKPISGTVSFNYNALGQQTSQTDENSHTTNYGYDQYGNRTVITDTLGNVTRLTYDLGGRVTDATDARGHTTRTEYDAADHVITVTRNYDPARAANEADQYNITTQYGYDPAGNPTFITNTLGMVTRTDYDFANRPLTVTVNYIPGGPNDTQTNLTAVYSYDSNGNRLSVTDAKNQTTQFAYDALNRLQSTTDANIHTTQYSYDAIGNLTRVLDANNNSSQTRYDKVNRPISVTNGLNNRTLYGYDALGNRTLITDALNVVTRFGYDDLNRLTGVTENYRPGLPVTVDQNVATTYGYDNVGNLLGALDANSASTNYTYDELDRLKTTRDPLGHITTLNYDGVGNLSSRLDANNATTIYQYDGLDRLTGIIYPTSSVAFAYDALGNRKTMTDTAGVSQYEYDAVYRLVRITDPFNQSVGSSYDRAGNRIGLSYPDGKSVSYDYDPVNLLKSVTDWNTQMTQYIYDNANRLTNTTLPNGVSMGYAYDNANGLTMIEYARRGTTLLARVGYVLDAVGNRTRQEESIRSVESGVLAPIGPLPVGTRVYLPLISSGDTASPNSAAASTPTISPSATAIKPASTLAQTAAPSATASAKPTSTLTPALVATQTNTTTRTRTPTSAATQTKLANTITPSATSTPTAQPSPTNAVTPTRTQTRSAFAPAGIFLLGYQSSGSEGDALRIGVLAPATKTPTPTSTMTYTPTPTPTALPTDANNTVIEYTYDPLYRLTQAKYSTYSGGPLSPILLNRSVKTQGLAPAARATATSTPTRTPTPFPLGVVKTITYTYDAVGNRLTQNDNAALTNYGYDIANRLTSVNGVTYTWDNNGNLLSDGTRAFQYDTANRLTQVVSGTTTTTFAYNGLGDRLSQTVGVTQTRYALDPGAGLTQVLADGTNTYLYGIGRVAQQQSTIQYFGADGLGSVRQLYNSSGQIIANKRYDPFGNTISQSGAGTSNYGYTGEWTDATGLEYLRARYYDPVTGRFITRDPVLGLLSAPETMNGYAYANNNPALYIDPSGECYGPFEFLRQIPGENLNCTNLDSAVSIVTNGKASLQDRAGAATYIVAMGGSHIVGAGGLVLSGPTGQAAVVYATGYGFYDNVRRTNSSAWLTTPGSLIGYENIRRDLATINNDCATLWQKLTAGGDAALYFVAGATLLRGRLAFQASNGSITVYRSVDAAGKVRYVGITNNLSRRAAEHFASKRIIIEPALQNLSRADARAVEQALIETHGLEKNGGTLMNKINSIAESNPEYQEALKRGYELLQSIGYK